MELQDPMSALEDATLALEGPDALHSRPMHCTPDPCIALQDLCIALQGPEVGSERPDIGSRDQCILPRTRQRLSKSECLNPCRACLADGGSRRPGAFRRRAPRGSSAPRAPARSHRGSPRENTMYPYGRRAPRSRAAGAPARRAPGQRGRGLAAQRVSVVSNAACARSKAASAPASSPDSARDWASHSAGSPWASRGSSSTRACRVRAASVVPAASDLRAGGSLAAELGILRLGAAGAFGVVLDRGVDVAAREQRLGQAPAVVGGGRALERELRFAQRAVRVGDRLHRAGSERRPVCECRSSGRNSAKK